MNKRLFCALCCVGVAGYAAEKGKTRPFLEGVSRSSTESKIISQAEVCRSYLRDICSFFDSWNQLQEQFVPLCQQLEPLYKRRIQLKLLDNPSMMDRYELIQLSSNIQTLEQKIQEILTCFNYKLVSTLMPCYYDRYCSDLIRAIHEASPHQEQDS